MTRRTVITAAGGALAFSPVRKVFAADLPLVHVSIVPIFVVAPHVVEILKRLQFFQPRQLAQASRRLEGPKPIAGPGRPNRARSPSYRPPAATAEPAPGAYPAKVMPV